jgi:Gluconate 2-dehydrogenase subunit 3
MDRRALLEWMVAAGGLAALSRLSAQDLLRIGADAHQSVGATSAPAGALDARATQMVTIAAEHIIPSTDTPGATQANVATFIDRMLSDWYPPADRARFLAGLAELDARSVERSGQPFVAATAADQVALLEASDAEVTALRRSTSAVADEHWFAMLKYLSVWGYCTSEVGMRSTLQTWPKPMRYDGNAAVG